MSTITERLHARSDTNLKDKLEKTTKWIWDERTEGERPKLEDFPGVKTAYGNAGESAPREMPWIGSIQQQFLTVAFAYLRDKYRDAAVTEFMDKINSMAAEMENLGIVIQQNEENQQP